MIEPEALEANRSHTDSDSLDHLLIVGCLNCLSQCELLLNTISADAYVDVSHGTSSVGAHVRHILDRFQSFFIGLSHDCINYDDRKRDPSIETNIKACHFALTSLSRRIDSLDMTELDGRAIQVRETVYSDGPSLTITSTLARELMGLVSHSTHHLAIIALIIKPLGFHLGADFGKAPSTIQYQRT